MDGDATRLYNELRARARVPAVGVLQGPLDGFRPSRRPIVVVDEWQKADYTRLADGGPGATFVLEHGGGGEHTKFTRGFKRRLGLGDEQARERAAREVEHARHWAEVNRARGEHKWKLDMVR